MTKLIELFNRIENDEEILATLERLYPHEAINRDGYTVVLGKIEDLQPVDTRITVHYRLVSDEFDESPLTYMDVYGTSPDTSFPLTLVFVPWAEWLGSEVSPESEEAFTTLEILAMSLYEMTFHGYSEERIRQLSEEVESMFDETEGRLDWDDEEGWKVM